MLRAGQTGSIFVTQDGTGSRTLSYGTSWEFPAATAPTLTTTAAAVDRIDYIVKSSTSIQAVATSGLCLIMPFQNDILAGSSGQGGDYEIGKSYTV